MQGNNPNFGDDYAHEGLPQADDYDPEALGTTEFRAGEAEQEWPEYGLELVPVEYRSRNAGSPHEGGWVDTGRRMVTRNGEFIADVTEQYKLLPNERLVGSANDVARKLGAEPFHEYDGEWYVELDDHVFQNRERTRVHALYAWQDGDVGGDQMSYGFAVHNSIDGSLGFSVGLFTFRHACANMVFLGTGSSREESALRVEDERELVNTTKHQHTQGLAVEKDELESIITGTLTFVDDVHDTYKQWVSERLTPDDVIDLLNLPSVADRDLPDWIVDTRPKAEREESPMNDVMTVLEAAEEAETDEDEELAVERQKEIISDRIPDVTKWETYNDLTEAAWHAGSSNDTTRRSKMRDVHKVFDPAPEAEVTIK